MAIIVKLKTSKVITAEHRKQQAIGIIDEYGNPFRIIKLRWNKNPMHKNVDYAKTRGFEDAIISKDRMGEIAITYRRNGSVQWMRYGGEGPYMGEVAQTPRNMRLLGSTYGDKLFTILDADINQIVKKMYEDRQAKYDENTKKINEARIAGLHTRESEKGEKAIGPVELPIEAERISVSEQNRLNQIEKQNNEKRKAALDEKEDKLDKRIVDMVGQGVEVVSYTEDFLRSVKGLQKLRGICRELKVKWELTEKKDDLINKIIKTQNGNTQAVKKQMEEVLSKGLDE